MSPDPINTQLVWFSVNFLHYGITSCNFCPLILTGALLSSDAEYGIFHRLEPLAQAPGRPICRIGPAVYTALDVLLIGDISTSSTMHLTAATLACGARLLSFFSSGALGVSIHTRGQYPTTIPTEARQQAPASTAGGGG